MQRIHLSIGTAIVLCLLLCACPAETHDIHISYCQATLSGTTFAGKVTYYKDDFEKALKNWSGGQTLSPDRIKQLQTGFLQSQFHVAANGRSLPMTITASGLDNASVWFQFSFTAPARITSLTIDHTVLFREYNDQMNLIGIKSAGKEYSYIFTPSKKTMSVQL